MSLNTVSRVRQMLAAAPLTEELIEQIVFGVQRELIDVSGDSSGDHGRHLHYDTVRQLLVDTGVRAAWVQDQFERSVPVVCPDWCDGGHGMSVRQQELVDELAAKAGEPPLSDLERQLGATVIGPFDVLVSHETTLALGTLPGHRPGAAGTPAGIAVYYVEDQAHPDHTHKDRQLLAPRPHAYVTICFSDEDMEFDPRELAAAAERITQVLGTAGVRLAKIRDKQGERS